MKFALHCCFVFTYLFTGTELGNGYFHLAFMHLLCTLERYWVKLNWCIPESVCYAWQNDIKVCANIPARPPLHLYLLFSSMRKLFPRFKPILHFLGIEYRIDFRLFLKDWLPKRNTKRLSAFCVTGSRLWSFGPKSGRETRRRSTKYFLNTQIFGISLFSPVFPRQLNKKVWYVYL